MSAPRILRRIVVGGVAYRWRVKHSHAAVPPAHEGGGPSCGEVFTAFVEGYRSAPLMVRFNEGPGRGAGYPEAGVVWIARTLKANLNRPVNASRLIALGRRAGWAPEQDRRMVEITDGWAWLPALVDEHR